MPSAISDYALIEDGRTCALVSGTGAIDFLCWPRFDSDACQAMARVGVDRLLKGAETRRSADMQGREDEATTMLERVIGLSNDVGLLSEQYHAPTRRLIGDIPQSLTHLGMVNMALFLWPMIERTAVDPLSIVLS